MKKLEEKIAIITGGAQGIGGGISRRFGEEGAILANKANKYLHIC